MCNQNQLRTLEDNSKPMYVDVLLYDHTPIHITLETKMLPIIKHVPLIHLKENKDSFIKIFMHSKRIDTFIYELLVVYILNCIGAEKYKCHVQLFENVDDICLLMNLIHAINKKMDIDLSLLLNNEEIQVTLHGKIIYKTDIL